MGKGRLHFRLAEMSQLHESPFSFLARPACARSRGRYAEPSCFKHAFRSPWSWAIGSSTSARPRGRLTWFRAVKKPGRSC